MIKKLTTWIKTILRYDPWIYGNLGSLTARKHKVFKRVEILVIKRKNPKHDTWGTAHSDHWNEFKANINPNRVQKKYEAPRPWGDPV